MSVSRKKMRELLLQILYSKDIVKHPSEDWHLNIISMLPVAKNKHDILIDECKKILSCLGEIDKMISDSADEYAIDRISKVEVNILRIAFYELFFEKLSADVVISESIRLSGKFSVQSAGSFVHAVIHKAMTNYCDKFSPTEEKS